MRKWIPVDELDITGLENWLHEMAQNGFRLVKMGRIWATFESREPGRLSYHLEPASEKNRAAYESFGWEYIGETPAGFEIYCTTRKTLRIPPRDEDTLKQLQKTQRKTSRMTVVSLAVWVLLLAAGAAYYGDAVMVLLEDVTLGMLLVLFAFQIQEIITAYRRRRYLKRVEEQKPTSTQRRKTKAVAWIVLAALLLGEGSLYLWRQAVNWTGSIEETRIAYTTLEELEADEVDAAFSRKEYGNTAEFKSSFLAPVQYELRQSGRLENGQEPLMKTRYFELTSEGLAKSVMTAQVQNQLRWSDRLKPQEIAVEGADQVITAEYQGLQYLFLRRGCRVTTVFYLGSQDLAEKAELFVKMVEENE